MRVYIIRHGETEANVAGVLQGRTDGALAKGALALASETGSALGDVRFDVAFSSPLRRAVETADAVLGASGNGDVDILLDDRLLEVDMGEFEDKRFRPGEREVDAGLCRLFFEEPASFPGFPGGETLQELCTRTQEFLSELPQSGYETVLVSTHGASLRAMLNQLYDDTSDFWQGHVPYNCSVSVVEASNGGMRLVVSDAVFYDEALCVDRYASY